MDRRRFLQALGIGAASAALPIPAYTRVTYPVGTVASSATAAILERSMYNTGTFAKAMWPGIRYMWDAEYHDFPLTSWGDLFEEKNGPTKQP